MTDAQIDRILQKTCSAIPDLQGGGLRCRIENEFGRTLDEMLEYDVFTGLWPDWVYQGTVPQLEINGIADYVAEDLGGATVVEYPDA